MKVSELAKRLGTSSKEAIELLKEIGVIAKTASSNVEDVAANTLLKLSAEIDDEKTAPKPAVPAVAPGSLAHIDTDKKKRQKPIKEKVVEEPVVEQSPVEEIIAPVIKIEAQVKLAEKASESGEAPVELKIIEIKEKSISIRNLSEKIGVKLGDIIKEGMKKGLMLNLNQEIDIAVASELVIAFNIVLDHEVQKLAEFQAVGKIEDEKDIKKLKPRPAIVTIMGHVDHGKTKLLDTIRSTNVMGGEAGGITQHIGAYQVKKQGKFITFIDTPGHEAFTTLRARGAQVTDIAIIVVAADDGIMPQTIEAIDHAKAAKVPIIVAVNKIDKPDANPEKVKQQLVEYDLTAEDWGGKTIVVPVSAKAGTGIDQLLEMILLVAEIQELKANPDKPANGIVIETHLSTSRGPVATVLIKGGTLRKGDPFVIGKTHGRIRAMFNDLGQSVDEAPPAYPVEILGINEAPMSGDILQVVESEKAAKLISDKRKLEEKQDKFRKPISLEDFSKEVKEKKANTDLNVILKADVRGSLEALISSLQKTKVKDIGVQVLHQATGIVNESDVMLAVASKAIILAFSVGVNPEAQKLAEKEKISIREYAIIYKLIDDVQDALEGMMEPEFEEVELGRAEVRSLFKSSKAGTIAGCFVLDGKLVRGGILNILRKDKVIFTGKLDNLKRFKDDAKEVQKGFECGLSVDGFNDIKEGDIFRISEMREIERKKRNG
ncbi:MAG: translation initiation factor IF-2 [Candidatus Margulisiibacteriota bacterium]|jgi:translation initiation factor IF-2